MKRVFALLLCCVAGCGVRPIHTDTALVEAPAIASTEVVAESTYLRVHAVEHDGQRIYVVEGMNSGTPVGIAVVGQHEQAIPTASHAGQLQQLQDQTEDLNERLLAVERSGPGDTADVQRSLATISETLKVMNGTIGLLIERQSNLEDRLPPDDLPPVPPLPDDEPPAEAGPAVDNHPIWDLIPKPKVRPRSKLDKRLEQAARVQ